MSNTTARSPLADRAVVLVEQDGYWQPASFQDAVARRREGGGPAIWVRVGMPADLVGVAEQLGLAPVTLRRLEIRWTGKEARHYHLERLPDGGLVLSSPTLSYVEQTQDVNTGEITILLADDVILTVEIGAAGTQEAAVERLASPDVPPEPGARRVLAAVLLELVSSAINVEIALAGAVADTEKIVFSESTPHPIRQIYALKREIAEARRALFPFGAEFADLVADDEDTHRSGQAKPWLQRLEKSVNRLDRRLEGHDRLLGDMVAASLSQISVRQNGDTRKISAWAAVAAVPTLAASIYGMNFQHMPELAWTYGYPAAVLAMAAICVVLYRVFKRSGWL